MSLPHYRNDVFLAESVRRYKQYLSLKKLHPDQFLVPCYDMDIVWHTHQVQPEFYASDTRSWLGHVLPHDDSVNDRTPGSKLCSSQEVTERLWRSTFGEPFSRPGAMYRGQPPNGKLANLTRDYQKSLLTATVHTMAFDSITWDPSEADKIRKYLEKGAHMHLKMTFVTKEGWNKNYVKKSAQFNVQDGGAKLSVPRSKLPNLEDVHLASESKLLCDIVAKIPEPKRGAGAKIAKVLKEIVLPYSSQQEILTEGGLRFVLKTLSESDATVFGTAAEEKECFKKSQRTSGKVDGKLTHQVSLIPNPKPVPVTKHFTIQAGSFYDCVVPQEIESMWGPVPIERLPDGVDNTCKAVCHRFVVFLKAFYASISRNLKKINFKKMLFMLRFPVI